MRCTGVAVGVGFSGNVTGRNPVILVVSPQVEINVTEEYAIHVFYPDGRAPESGVQAIAQLSDRWLTVCADMLDESGPVMHRNMGSTLSHFDVKMGGPIGQLSAHGHRCFDFAISLGADSEQDHATARHFRSLFERAVGMSGGAVATNACAVLDGAVNRPCLLLFDFCQPDVADDQKAALAQLGIHLAGAYYRYCDSQPKMG
jgi:hypothetical protein